MPPPSTYSQKRAHVEQRACGSATRTKRRYINTQLTLGASEVCVIYVRCLVWYSSNHNQRQPTPTSCPSHAATERRRCLCVMNVLWDIWSIITTKSHIGLRGAWRSTDCVYLIDYTRFLYRRQRHYDQIYVYVKQTNVNSCVWQSPRRVIWAPHMQLIDSWMADAADVLI